MRAVAGTQGGSLTPGAGEAPRGGTAEVKPWGRQQWHRFWGDTAWSCNGSKEAGRPWGFCPVLKDGLLRETALCSCSQGFLSPSFSTCPHTTPLELRHRECASVSCKLQDIITSSPDCTMRTLAPLIQGSPLLSPTAGWPRLTQQQLQKTLSAPTGSCCLCFLLAASLYSRNTRVFKPSDTHYLIDSHDCFLIGFFWGSRAVNRLPAYGRGGSGEAHELRRLVGDFPSSGRCLLQPTVQDRGKQ